MRLTKVVIGCKINKYDIVKAKVYKKLERHVLMKRTTLTKLTLVLTALTVTSALSGALALQSSSADEAVTYELSTIFSATDATLGADAIEQGIVDNANDKGIDFITIDDDKVYNF